MYIETRHLIERLRSLARSLDPRWRGNSERLAAPFAAHDWLAQAADRLGVVQFGARTAAEDAVWPHWAVVEDLPKGGCAIRRATSRGRRAAENYRAQACAAGQLGSHKWRIERIELSAPVANAREAAAEDETVKRLEDALAPPAHAEADWQCP